MRCDDGRILIHSERNGALQTVWAGEQHLEPTTERIGSNPCLVWRRQVTARGHDGCFDSLAPGRRDSLNVEDRDRHETILSERSPADDIQFTLPFCFADERPPADGQEIFWALSVAMWTLLCGHGHIKRFDPGASYLCAISAALVQPPALVQVHFSLVRRFCIKLNSRPSRSQSDLRFRSAPYFGQAPVPQRNFTAWSTDDSLTACDQIIHSR